MASQNDRSLKSEPNRLVEDLFGDALLLNPEQRRKFIDSKCDHDLELKAAVLRLVHSHERNEESGFILDQPVFPVEQRHATPTDASVAEREGDTIGRYRLL